LLATARTDAAPGPETDTEDGMTEAAEEADHPEEEEAPGALPATGTETTLDRTVIETTDTRGEATEEMIDATTGGTGE